MSVLNRVFYTSADSVGIETLFISTFHVRKYIFWQSKRHIHFSQTTLDQPLYLR